MTFPEALWIAAGIGAALIVLLLTWWARQRRKSVWERLAKKHSLRFYPEHPLVDGAIDGRPFRLGLSENSSDTGPLGIEVVAMSLGLKGILPEALDLRRSETTLGGGSLVPDENVVQTGDEEFDQIATVKGKDAVKVVAYLTARRKRALARLFSHGEFWNVGLSNGRIYIQDRNMAESLHPLRSRLRLLQEIAPELDADSANDTRD